MWLEYQKLWAAKIVSWRLAWYIYTCYHNTLNIKELSKNCVLDQFFCPSKVQVCQEIIAVTLKKGEIIRYHLKVQKARWRHRFIQTHPSESAFIITFFITTNNCCEEWASVSKCWFQKGLGIWMLFCVGSLVSLKTQEAKECYALTPTNP